MSATEALARIQPENDLEPRLLADPELRAGLEWGKPRTGHPEGSVAAHVVDLLTALDASGIAGERRTQLRFISIVHDAFKRRVREWLPKTGENHHAMRARRFAERYTDDEALLSTIELHDRPYAIWRRLQRTGSLDQPAGTNDRRAPTASSSFPSSSSTARPKARTRSRSAGPRKSCAAATVDAVRPGF